MAAWVPVPTPNRAPCIACAWNPPCFVPAELRRCADQQEYCRRQR